MRYLALLLSILTSFIASAAFPSSPPAVGYSFEEYVPAGITQDPWSPQGVAFLPDGTFHWWSRDQKGRIQSGTNWVTLIDNQAIAFAGVDTGMPSLIRHPTDSTRWFSFAGEKEIVNGVTNIYDTIREWRMPPGSFRLQPVRVILRQFDRSPEHLGFAALFGNDGYLYVSLSDEGGQGDPFNNSQRIDGNFFSAIMRIDVDGRPGNLPPNPHSAIQGQYWVPNDNPWIGATNFNGSPVDPSKVRTEFYMVGLRNPNTMVIDRQTGRIFVGDVGGSLIESVREVVKGGNAGWAAMEGMAPTRFPTGSSTVTRPPADFVPPVWSYPHHGVIDGWDPMFEGYCVFVGPVVRNNPKYPDLDGCLIVSDMGGAVWALNITNKSVRRIATHPVYASSWAVDPVTGDLIAGSFKGHSITRMVRAVPTQIPQTLSATGLFSDVESLTPAEGVFQYKVANPFWSDGATKERWVRLAGQINRDSNDKWRFAPGTFWVKQIDMGTNRLETRVTVATDSGTYGLSYRWDPDGEARLANPYGEDVAYPGGVWHIPGWADCARCHTASYSGSPGFRTAQLNVGGQLEAFSAAGWFAQPITNATSLPSLSRDDSTAPITHRFQSYLDANCSQCHQPGEEGRGSWDARITTPITLAGIIDGPVSDTLGLPDARVIARGSLTNSVLWQRIAYHDGNGLPAFHMPPLATAVINQQGADLVAEFVASTAPRTNWSIGSAPSSFSSFAQENNRNDPAPGSPVALDDDFYTAGVYPAGFNGLTSPLVVESDEPLANWERALALRDSTNRIHLVATAGPATLTVSLSRGATYSNGVLLPTPIHNLAFVHRGTDGVSKIFGTFSGVCDVTLTFPVQLVDGPQTIELIRTGPGWPTHSSAWVNFKFVRISR